MSKLSTIVYVEDDPAARRSFRETVALHLDNTVHYVAKAEELLARLDPAHPEHVLPNILLVDIDLPGMSGLHLVEAIRNRHQYLDLTPLIIVTGDYSDASKIAARAAGADWILGKPVTWFGFQDAIKNIHFKMGIFDARPVTEGVR